MKQQDFQRELARLTPEMPEAFRHRVEAFCAEKVDQEVYMKQTTKRALSFSSRALAFALIAVVLLGSVAFAASQWGLLDTLEAYLGGRPPQAETLLQGSLHKETVNNVEIEIREAAYDGRTLFVQYSHRMLDVTEPLGAMNAKEDLRWVGDEDWALLEAHNVGWWTDSLWINGQEVDMTQGSGGQDNGSEVPGEIIQTRYFRLDNAKLAFDGPMEITLPIGEIQPVEYSRSLYDPASGTRQVPEKGVVTFTLNAGDIQRRIKTFTSDQKTITPLVTAQVKEAVFTPLMTYIDLKLRGSEQVFADFKAENGEGYRDEQGNLLWEYRMCDMFDQWVCSLQLVDGSGTPLFPDYYGPDGYNDYGASFLFPYVDVETLPEELWLAPIIEGTADMTTAVRVK